MGTLKGFKTRSVDQKDFYQEAQGSSCFWKKRKHLGNRDRHYRRGDEGV